MGMGRHSPEEKVRLAVRDVDAIADYLGDKPYFMGSEPSSVDATLFAFAIGILCPLFETPIRTAAERHDTLKRYVGRMTARYYPGLQRAGRLRGGSIVRPARCWSARNVLGESNTPGHSRGLRTSWT